MLVLSRREFEEIIVGSDICITILRCERGHVRIGIDAPKNINIVRAELLDGEEESFSQSRFGKAF